ncbi:unnamed protein product [Musa textilis]
MFAIPYHIEVSTRLWYSTVSNTERYVSAYRSIYIFIIINIIYIMIYIFFHLNVASLLRRRCRRVGDVTYYKKEKSIVARANIASGDLSDVALATSPEKSPRRHHIFKKKFFY